jgi:hypothetical protein
MEEVWAGVVTAYHEMSSFRQEHAFFTEIGTVMQTEWRKGLVLSLQAELP